MFNMTFTKHNAMKIKKINKQSNVETMAGQRKILLLEITKYLFLDKKWVCCLFFVFKFFLIPLSFLPRNKV